MHSPSLLHGGLPPGPSRVRSSSEDPEGMENRDWIPLHSHRESLGGGPLWRMGHSFEAAGTNGAKQCQHSLPARGLGKTRGSPCQLRMLPVLQGKTHCLRDIHPLSRQGRDKDQEKARGNQWHCVQVISLVCHSSPTGQTQAVGLDTENRWAQWGRW